MAQNTPSDQTRTGRLLAGLREFQESVRTPVHDIATEAPAEAFHDLVDAVGQAPGSYRSYLQEALGCYEAGYYRAAILMVWSATMLHMYEVASGQRNGMKMFEAANVARFGGSNSYRPIRKRDDFLYLRDLQFIQLAEDTGMINRNMRKTLADDRLGLRNQCGHPSGVTVGRQETVVFIESLCLNVLNGSSLNW
jgi:hypothetical protein